MKFFPFILFYLIIIFICVLAGPVRVVTQVGETILFSCTWPENRDSENSASLAWFRKVNDSNVALLTLGRYVYAKDDRFGVYYDENKYKYTLQIHGTLRSDSGAYYCIEHDTKEAKLEEIHLQVNWYDDSMEILSVTQGEYIHLTCFHQVEPSPQLTWTRSSNRPLPNGNITYIGTSLSFHVTKDDRGEFFCTADEGNGKMITKKIILNVDFAPGIYVVSEQVKKSKGNALQLECLVDALPVPVILWSLNGTTIDEKNYYNIKIYQYTPETYFTLSILRVPSVQTEHYGRYVCTVTNSIQTSEKVILVEPLD